MPHISLLDLLGRPGYRTHSGPEAEDLLRAVGAQCGHWPARADPVSSLPQLTYARELLALQRRFDVVATQRRRIGPRDTGPEPATEHVHDDIELRVVLEGSFSLLLRAPAPGGWLRVDLQALEWLMVPAHLPHAGVPQASGPLDLLCLHTRPGGSRTRRAGVRPTVGGGSTGRLAAARFAATPAHARGVLADAQDFVGHAAAFP